MANTKETTGATDYTKLTQKELNYIKAGFVLMILLLLVVILLPHIFEDFKSVWFFDSDVGAIGDVIGGLTAPFVNLLAAFLVYKSFEAQIKANQDQIKNHNDQMDLLRQDQRVNKRNHDTEMKILREEQSFNQVKNMTDEFIEQFILKESIRNAFDELKDRVHLLVTRSNLYTGRSKLQQELFLNEVILEMSDSILNLSFLKEHIVRSKLGAKIKFMFYLKISNNIKNVYSGIDTYDNSQINLLKENYDQVDWSHYDEICNIIKTHLLVSNMSKL